MNQYTSRTLPGGADVIGTANASSTVTVNDQPTYRKGEYFWRELTIGNEWVPVCQSITNLAVLNDSPDPDIVTNSTGNVLLPATPETFLHDLDGNLVRDGLWTNTWNGENRLVRTESLSTVPESARARVDWTYLPDGRWIERIVSTWVSGDYVPQSTNRFVWDGQVLLGILDEENTASLSFMRGLDLSGTTQGAGGAGGLLAVTDHSTSAAHFVGNDGNGNVTLLVNATDGTENARYAYSPFGETIRATGEMAKENPIRFSTQFADEVTGDAKYLFREYRPTTGRWLSRDPIGEVGGINVVGFVRNNPVISVDLFDKKCCLITYKAGDDGSFAGHSILSCGSNNEIYISHWPQSKGGPWHDPEQDKKEFSTSIPAKICTDCLDETSIREWFASKQASGDRWTCLSNCADIAEDAIRAGLPQDKQKVHNCGRCGFWQALAGAYRYNRDVLSDSGINTGVINYPTQLANRFMELIENTVIPQRA